MRKSAMFILPVLACASLTTFCFAQAQEGPDPQRRPKLETRVLTLQKVDADEFIDMIHQVFNVRQIAREPRTHSVVVRADADTLSEIEQLHAKLEMGTLPEQKVIVQDVGRGSENVAYVIHEMFDDVEVISEDRSGHLILRGSEPVLLKVVKIIEQLRMPDANKTMVITIDLIKATTGSKERGALPENLAEVGGELVNQGLGRLTHFGHLMTRTEMREEFTANGVVRTDDAQPSSYISIEGQADRVNNEARLTIEVEVQINRQGPPDVNGSTVIRENLHLSTTSQVPFGDYLVLGAVPSRLGDSDTILIVVRVTAQ